MKKHWDYLKYLVRHKFYVAVAGWFLGVSAWRLFTHDLSKFLPSEWFPYVDKFYDQEKTDREANAYGFPLESAPWGTFLDDRFMVAWLFHQHRNPHHWQYWVMRKDTGGVAYSVGIPHEYLLEMVADWAGAGRAISGKWDLASWWSKNKDKMRLRLEDVKEIDRLVTMLDVRLAGEFGI